MKKRADIIMDLLNKSDQIKDDLEIENYHRSSPSIIEGTPQTSDCYLEKELHNGIQYSQDDSRVENFRPSSPSIIEDTPPKSDCNQKYLQASYNERKDSKQSPLLDKNETIYSKKIIPADAISSSSTGTSILPIDASKLEEPLTPKGVCRTVAQSPKNYRESPMNTGESDAGLSDDDPTYRKRLRSRLAGACKKISSSSSSCSSSSSSSSNSSSSSSSTSSDSAASEATTPITPTATDSQVPNKSRKRQRNPQAWKQNLAKLLRNSGKEYVSHTSKSKKVIPARSVKNPCTSKCRLKCTENITETDRNTIFESYWALSDIDLQRSFIRNSMLEVQPKYKYTNFIYL